MHGAINLCEKSAFLGFSEEIGFFFFLILLVILFLGPFLVFGAENTNVLCVTYQDILHSVVNPFKNIKIPTENCTLFSFWDA